MLRSPTATGTARASARTGTATATGGAAPPRAARPVSATRVPTTTHCAITGGRAEGSADPAAGSATATPGATTRAIAMFAGAREEAAPVDEVSACGAAAARASRRATACRTRSRCRTELLLRHTRSSSGQNGQKLQKPGVSPPPGTTR